MQAGGRVLRRAGIWGMIKTKNCVVLWSLASSQCSNMGTSGNHRKDRRVTLGCPCSQGGTSGQDSA